MKKKLLDFNASISEVTKVNHLFSTCKVRVLYVGKNRNMSIITKDAVEKALPTLKNIPIVGEFNEEISDYKDHGGKVNLDSYKYVHTTKPYGVVPESATYSWEDVKGRDGITRQYLTIDGCYLWTGRYEEAYSIIENGKGQSMEIEVVDGRWDEPQKAYQIDDFVFSALCILGDDVEPAFEDANITAYSLNKDTFRQEFSLMLGELKNTLYEKEEDNEMLKELLQKYSTTMEALTAKGLVFSEISEDELENEIAKVLEVEVIKDEDKKEDSEEVLADEKEVVDEGNGKEGESNDINLDVKDKEEIKEEAEIEKEGESTDVALEQGEEKAEVIEGDKQIQEPDVQKQDETEAKDNDKFALLEAENARLKTLVEELEKFKLKAIEEKQEAEKAQHEETINAMFSNFQLTEEEVKDIDIHKFTVSEIEDKCYAIIGRKMATKKSFSKSKEEGSLRLPLQGKSEAEKMSARYGDLFEK